MENLDFIEKLNELVSGEDLLAVSRDVNELRGKFDDYILEEERKIQVAELEAQEKNEAIEESVEAKKAELVQLKDDFFEIFKGYQQKKKDLIEARNNVEKANLSEKIALINRLREIVTSEENIGAAFAAFKDIQEKWKEVGDIPRNKRNDIQTDYSRLLEDFFYNIKIYKELKDHDFHRNHQLKTSLIGELKKLNEEKSIKKVEAKLKKLQNDWNDIGPVPNEEWEALKESYWTEVRSVYDKINRFYDDRRAKLQSNLEEKKVLLEKTQEIVSEIENIDSAKGWDKAASKVLDIQKQWKTVGFGPKKENDAIWKSFRATCDEFFNAKKAFFGVVNEKYDAIADKKKELIEKAKALKTSTDWRDTADKLKRLQQQWKTLGHSGGRNEQKLWKEFRGACDDFFNARQNHFAEKDKEFEGNLTLKEDLLKKMEAYKPAKEKKDALLDLKNFTTEFNAIGMVPMKSKDKIFKAYKAVMDKHYGALKMEGVEKDKIMFQAKIDTLKSSPNAYKAFNDMKFDLRKDIDKQKKEIAQLENNLGFFANSKGADALKKDVEKKVERAKERIEGIKAKLKMIPSE